MSFDAKNKDDFKKLVDSLKYNKDGLTTFRDKRVKAIREYVGMNYSDRGTSYKVPLNLLELMVNIYTTQLVAKNPRSNVTTRAKELKPAAKTLELATNHLIQEIDLGKTLKEGVTDAVFSIGITKVGLNYSKTVEIGGFKHDVGQPFADNVQLDDFVFDLKARKWETISFAADRYRIPIEQVKKCGLYNKSVANKLVPEDESHEFRNEERASKISENTNKEFKEDEFKDYCELWDVWLPEENLIITCNLDIEEPLRVTKWTGPEHGPYHLLGFNTVPGNVMPLSPASTLIDLHELTNKIFRQLARQAERQKTVTFANGKSIKDAERVVNANDGEVIRVDEANGIKEARFGGPDQQNMLFAQQARQLFSYMGGNLDSVGGLSPQADTAKQEQLISGASSQRLASMGEQVQEWASAIINDLSWYLWHDPLINMPVVKRVEGTDIEVVEHFSPETQEGDFFDYNINVNPYSLKEKTPSEQVQATMQYINMMGPWMPMMQQQGMNIDFDKLTDMVSDFGNIPSLKDIITFSGSPQESEMIGQPTQKIGSMMGQNEYKHSYTSQSSLQGSENAMMSMLGQQGAGAQEGLAQSQMQGQM